MLYFFRSIQSLYLLSLAGVCRHGIVRAHSAHLDPFLEPQECLLVYIYINSKLFVPRTSFQLRRGCDPFGSSHLRFLVTNDLKFAWVVFFAFLKGFNLANTANCALVDAPALSFRTEPNRTSRRFGLPTSLWRVKAGFHTLPQVSVGAVVGALDAALWYRFCRGGLTSQVRP